MRKMDDFAVNPNVIWMFPPDPIKEESTIDLAESLIPPSQYKQTDYTKLRRYSGEDTFTMKIGGTTYEVSTHFCTDGVQSVLEQFKNLILSENLI